MITQVTLNKPISKWVGDTLKVTITAIMAILLPSCDSPLQNKKDVNLKEVEHSQLDNMGGEKFGDTSDTSRSLKNILEGSRVYISKPDYWFEFYKNGVLVYRKGEAEVVSSYTIVNNELCINKICNNFFRYDGSGRYIMCSRQKLGEKCSLVSIERIR